MALTGNFLTSGWHSDKGDYLRIKFTYTATQSISGNYSDIAWQIAGDRTASGYVTSGGFRVIINGDTVLATKDRIRLYNGTVAASGTKRIYHNTSGAASLSVSVEAGVYWIWNLSGSPTVSGSKTFTLDTIPRAATLKSAPNFNDEANPTITYTNPAGSAVTSIEACISLDGTADDVPYRALSKSGTSYTFKLTDAERATLRNGTKGSNSRTVIFYIRTKIGGEMYHSTLYRTLTIVNAAPILSPVITDTNADTAALTGGGALIRYFSNAYFKTGAKAQKGATITSQSVTCAGVTMQGATGTFVGVLGGSFVFTATDSRGNTTTLTVPVPFVEYVAPTCSIGNNKPDTDGNFTLVASGACFNGDIASSGSNDLYVLYRFKASGGTFSDWMDMSIAKGDNSYTATAEFTGLDYRTTYVFQCKVGDLVTTATTDEVAIKAIPVFDWSGEDFNFNVPVAAPSLAVSGDFTLGGIQMDYIVEQGTSGNWVYRKWNSGLAECWGFVKGSTAVTGAWGSCYSSGNDIKASFPFAFTDYPIVQATPVYDNGGNFWIATDTAGTSKTQTAQYQIVRPNSFDPVAYKINFYAIGHWK